MTVEETGQFQESEQPIAEGQTAQPQVTPSPESEAQTEVRAPKPEQTPVEKRISKLTWERHDAERRFNAELMARQAAEQRLQQFEWQQQEAVRQQNAPRVERYTDAEQFNRDNQAYTQQLIAEERQRAQNAVQAQRQSQAQQQYNSFMQARVSEGKQKFADYEEVVGNSQLPPLGSVNPAVLSALLEHEKFSEITYFLGKNPDEAHRIAAMQPARAILEVGRIAANLERPARQTTQASAPPATVGGATPAASKNPNDMSGDEFYRYFQKQRRAGKM